jgi:hypothetical protein
MIGAVETPYILQKDVGNKPSIFVKIIRVLDDSQADTVKNITDVDVVFENSDSKCSELLCRAFCITLSDGFKDLWFVGDPENKNEVIINCPQLPCVSTDATASLVRFDRKGNVVSVYATGANFVKIKGQKELYGNAEIAGKIQKIYVENGTTIMEVINADKLTVTPDISGLPVITTPAFGQSATWRLKKIKRDKIISCDVKPSMGATVLTPVKEKEGWYKSETTISRFYASGLKQLKRDFIIGRSVYEGKHFIGRIEDISEKGDYLKIDLENNNEPQSPFTAIITEAGPSDNFKIPLNLKWKKEAVNGN